MLKNHLFKAIFGGLVKAEKMVEPPGKKLGPYLVVALRIVMGTPL
jgi:hypothetical protein